MKRDFRSFLGKSSTSCRSKRLSHNRHCFFRQFIAGLRELPVSLSVGNQIACWCCCLLLFIQACNNNNRGEPHSIDQPGAQAKITGTASGSVKREPVDIFPKNSGEGILWRDLLKEGRYKLAEADDFRFPKAALITYNSDISNFISLPYTQGDFNGDGAVDVAGVMVDTKKSDNERFGIIILNGTISSVDNYLIAGLYPNLSWVYQGKDLSKSTISYTLRGGLEIRRYNDDRSQVVSSIKWSKQKKAYYCTNPIIVSK